MQNIYAIRHYMYIEQLSNANLANSKVVVLKSNIATDGKTARICKTYICSSYSMIVRVSVVLRRTVVGD